jgi:N-ethylmaleimide reductase
MTDTKLFDSIQTGSNTFQNRIWMAPLTRSRADLNTNVPNDLMKEYYTQRASAGLIITEFTSITNDAITFLREPCIADDAQVEKWKEIVDAVHEKGGKIFCQIAHGGRAAHPLSNEGRPGVAPSPIALTHRCGGSFNPSGEEQEYVEPPTELTDKAADAIVQVFREAARKAVKVAGFDGVEVHGANGYLIDQFLCETSNKRPETSKYAGTSLETRSRFLKEVLTNITEEVGSDRVGLRISPLNSYQDMNRGDNAAEEVKFVSSMANDFNLAYLHVMRADFFGVQKGDVITPARETFKNTLVVNMGYDSKEALEGITSGKFDAVAFGTKFLANPDLPHRISKGSELNTPKAELFYTDGAPGYTDYPFLEDDEKKEA